MKSSLASLPRPIWALFAVRLVVAAGNFVFPFLTLILTSRMGWPANKAGLFMSAMQTLALPSMFLGGKLSDVFGRKKVMMGCQALAVVLFLAALAVGYQPFMPFLIAAASIILSMTWPVSGALVADLVPPESRKTAYSLLYWGNNIGFSIGPLAAGFLFRTAPGLIFLGNAIALSISIFVLQKFIPSSIPPQKASDSETEKPHDGSLWSALAANPSILVFSVLFLMMNFVYSQHMFSLPIFLEGKMGAAGAGLFGAVMTANGLTVVIFTLPLTRLTARVPVLGIIAISSLLYALGFGMLALPFSTPLVLVSTLIWTWGEILSATNANVYIASRSPSNLRGRISSVSIMISNIGQLSAPVVSGIVIAARGASAVWPMIMVIATLAAMLLFGLSRFENKSGMKSKG
jgi:MFS family permease